MDRRVSEESFLPLSKMLSVADHRSVADDEAVDSQGAVDVSRLLDVVVAAALERFVGLKLETGISLGSFAVPEKQ